MDDKVDLGAWLKSWPYDPDNDVRLAAAPDGRQVLQVRLPLGVEQYELEGRPDGERPHDRESVLAYQLERLTAAERTGGESGFSLNPEECAELFAEGTLYYYRYVHLFQIKEWRRTVLDTSRNLRLFDLVNRYAQEEDDRGYLEQWRPYLLRMNSVAEAMLHLDEGDFGAALAAVQAAIACIEALDELEDETFQFERERSLSTLRQMATQIEENQPVSEVEALERELRAAVERQNFEHAAHLRDRIRALRNPPAR